MLGPVGRVCILGSVALGIAHRLGVGARIMGNGTVSVRFGSHMRLGVSQVGKLRFGARAQDAEREQGGQREAEASAKISEDGQHAGANSGPDDGSGRLHRVGADRGQGVVRIPERGRGVEQSDPRIGWAPLHQSSRRSPEHAPECRGRVGRFHGPVRRTLPRRSSEGPRPPLILSPSLRQENFDRSPHGSTRTKVPAHGASLRHPGLALGTALPPMATGHRRRPGRPRPRSRGGHRTQPAPLFVPGDGGSAGPQRGHALSGPPPCGPGALPRGTETGRCPVPGSGTRRIGGLVHRDLPLLRPTGRTPTSFPGGDEPRPASRRSLPARGDPLLEEARSTPRPATLRPLRETRLWGAVQPENPGAHRTNPRDRRHEHPVARGRHSPPHRGKEGRADRLKRPDFGPDRDGLPGSPGYLGRTSAQSPEVWSVPVLQAPATASRGSPPRHSTRMHCAGRDWPGARSARACTKRCQVEGVSPMVTHV